MGFLLAIMPGLESSGGSVQVAYTALRLIGLSILFTFASYLIRFPLLWFLGRLYNQATNDKSSIKLFKTGPPGHSHTAPNGAKEVFLLAVIGILLIYIGVGHLFEQSIELSCFVAGFGL